MTTTAPETVPETTDTYHHAAQLQLGWQLRHNDTWQDITSLVQIESPMAFAMVTLADGLTLAIPHTHDIPARTPAEAHAAV